MIIEKIFLKEVYPFLCETEKRPYLNIMCHEAKEVCETKPYSDPKPAIVLLPGGGYAGQSARESIPIATRFFTEGYNVFTLYYSVKPQTHPWPIIECAAVFDFIENNKEKYYTDTTRIAIMGFSAGGHASAHYSVEFDSQEVKKYFPNAKRPDAVVLGYPVILGDPERTHKDSIRNISGSAEFTEEVIEKFSLDRHVKENTPPTFIWHTATDKTVPVANSFEYAQALIKKGIPCELQVYPFGAHGLSTANDITNANLPDGSRLAEDWIPACVKFLNFILNK